MDSGSESIRDIVERRLNEDSGIGSTPGLLVLAALDGTLPATLRGEDGTGAQPPAGAARPAPVAYLTSLAVEGFRGIGPRASLTLPVGPGLTVVVGRNGSGKSSFAEALEFLLTGTTGRWEGRTAEWREGWQNLHHEGPTAIEAVLAIEGVSAPTTVARRWSIDARTLEEHETFVQTVGEPRTTLDTLGWEGELVTHRPFLSHNELGALFEQGPTARFDAMSALLGLELVSEARSALRQERLERERLLKQAKADLDSGLFPLLSDSGDERAIRCTEALTGSAWDLDAVDLVLAGALHEEADAPLDTLRRLLAVETASAEAVAEAVSQLRAAAAGLERMSGSAPQRARRIVAVLERALEVHEHEGDQPCPVCGAGTLDSAWRAEAEQQLRAFREDAREAEAASRAADAAVRAGMELLAELPPILERGRDVGVETDELCRRWGAWTLLPERDEVRSRSLERYADHLESSFPPVEASLRRLHEAAQAELERREDAWRPLAARLRAWLPTARSAQAGATQIGDIRTAEGWLGTQEGSLRDERFRPIAEQATAIWQVLRQNSNVSLDELALTGSAARRKLEMSVSIDGVGGAALAVMSQGELNALALSLFLPRAMMPESPFRFVVIDDPVQAMDPSKVDGLARVLEDVASSRQVIVLTHDDRLPEAIRRLDVPATIVEVTRRPDSVVECRTALDPVERYAEDARALMRTEGLADAVAERVVPGFCRLALEAACTESVRRRRLGRGETHANVEALLAAATSLVEKLGLLLFDEPGHGGEAIARTGQRWGSWAGDAAGLCNRGSHQGLARGRLDNLVRDSTRLADELRQVK